MADLPPALTPLAFPDPPDISLPPELRWHVPEIPPGTSLEGLILAAPVRVAVHYSGGRSVPCTRLFTSGTRECWCDLRPTGLRVLGYLPLLSREGEQLVVPVSQQVAQRLSSLQLLAPVILIRSTRAKRPLGWAVAHESTVGQGLRRKAEALKGVSIHRYLLYLWQDPILCEHYGVPYLPSARRREALGGDIQSHGRAGLSE